LRAAPAATAAITLVLAVAGSVAVAQEAGGAWTQYQGGPAHHGAIADGPQPPFRVRWSLPAPAGEALSGAVVVDQIAIAVGSEAVYGVDVATGTVTWEIVRAGGPLSMPAVAEVNGSPALLFLEGPEEDAEPSPSASVSPSPTATGTGSPTATGTVSPVGEVVGPDEEAPMSFLIAVSLEDRSEIWRVPFAATTRSGVTVDGDTAYVGDQARHVMAVALADGAISWTAEVPGRIDAPVAVADGRVYAVARDRAEGRAAVVALDAATGERAWAVVPQATSTLASAPSAGDGSVFVGAADRLVRSLASEDGTERWASLVLSFFTPFTALAVDDGAVYAADVTGGLYRLDVADGERRWGFQLNDGVIRSAPAVSGSTVLLGTNDGRLVAVDTDSGHLVWESEATPGLVGTIALGPDVVIAVKGGRDAGLIAFEPDPDGSLVDLPSPTELDAGTTFSRYAIAAAIVLLVALVPGIAIRRRLGPADLTGAEASREEPDNGSEPENGKEGAE
jgi:outer membrane protein assembly factor BamB